jgi:hypothetical protein
MKTEQHRYTQVNTEILWEMLEPSGLLAYYAVQLRLYIIADVSKSRGAFTFGAKNDPSKCRES